MDCWGEIVFLEFDKVNQRFRSTDYLPQAFIDLYERLTVSVVQSIMSKESE